MKAGPVNPIGGISVPSIDDMVDEIIHCCGLAKIDMAVEADRKRFRAFLVKTMRRGIRWELQAPLEKATAKAVSHVLSLMEDPNYQETRRARRKVSRERMAERQAERDRERVAERQAHKLKNAGGHIQ